MLRDRTLYLNQKKLNDTYMKDWRILIGQWIQTFYQSETTLYKKTRFIITAY